LLNAAKCLYKALETYPGRQRVENNKLLYN